MSRYVPVGIDEAGNLPPEARAALAESAEILGAIDSAIADALSGFEGGGEGNSTIAAVQVVTGNEARPDAPTVFWMNPDSISPIVNLIEGVDVDVNPDAVGPVGPQGPQGPAGPTGPGVPNGGTTGQALVKTSNADQATTWATNSGGGGGGSSRGFGYQKLRSNSAIRMFDANRVDSNEWNTYNRLCYCPVWIGWPGNDFRHWYTRVDTAVTGAVARYGIYDANLDGTPASKLVEAGPHSLPNTPDVTVFSMSAFQVPSPGLYFLAIVLQGTAGAKLARYVSNLAPFGSSPFGEAFNPADTGGAPAIAYEDGVTGALPATATVSGWSNVGAYVALRVE